MRREAIFNVIKYLFITSTIIIIIFCLIIAFVINDNYYLNANSYENIYNIKSVVELSTFWYNIISLLISSFALIGVFAGCYYQNSQLRQMRAEYKAEVKKNNLSTFFVMYNNWRQKVTEMRIVTHLYKMESNNVVNLKRQSFVVGIDVFADLVKQFEYNSENLDENDSKFITESFVSGDYVNYLNLLFNLVKYSNDNNFDDEEIRLMKETLCNSMNLAERSLLDITFNKWNIRNNMSDEMKNRLKEIENLYVS